MGQAYAHRPLAAVDDRLSGEPRRPGLAYQACVLSAFLVCGPLLSSGSLPWLWATVFGHPVLLSIDGQTRSYVSLQGTVANVLREAKVEVRDGDRVNPTLETVIWPGIRISVERALPVIVRIAGAKKKVRLAAPTVGDALARMNVQVRPGDRIYPNPLARLAPWMRITVERRDVRTWVEARAIPPGHAIVEDTTLFKGQRVVRSSGSPGEWARVVRVEYADGHPVSVATLGQTVVKHPVPRLIAIGTRILEPQQPAASGGTPMVMEATAYYPGPNNYGGGVGPKTAIGLLARLGIVAVDPSVIPLGTRLRIEGYGNAVAADTGGDIHGRRVDLCFNTYQEAIRFGRRIVRVYILGKPEPRESMTR